MPEAKGKEITIPEQFMKEFARSGRIILGPIGGVFPLDPGMLKHILDHPEVLKEGKVIFVPNGVIGQ